MKEKLKVGVFGITGCKGCELSIAFNEDELVPLLDKIDFYAWPFIDEKSPDEVLSEEGKFDLVFMEGLVACEEDLELLKKVREKTNYLVALGACAHTAGIPAYRNAVPQDSYAHLMYEKIQKIKDRKPTPISEHVKVDFTLPGCPPCKEEILEFLMNFVYGKEPKKYKKPVCVECLRNGNKCLLLEGKFCMGPLTAGGCNSICTNGGFECWGCRGPTGDANYRQFVKHLRDLGFDDDFIKKRFNSFNFGFIKWEDI